MIRSTIKISVFLALISLINGCDSSSINRIEAITHSETPPMKNLLTIDDWDSFTGDGASLRIYEIDSKYKWIDESNCIDKGLKKELFHKMDIKIQEIKDHFSLENYLCYKIVAEDDLTEAVFIQGKKVFFYWGLH